MDQVTQRQTTGRQDSALLSSTPYREDPVNKA
jgi:hypothetical protein